MLDATALNGAAPAESFEPPKPKRPVMANAAFHGPMGRYVEIAAPWTEADPVALLGHGLVMFGNAAGRATYFEIEDARHHLNEFVVFVGPTAKLAKAPQSVESGNSSNVSIRIGPMSGF